MRRSIGLVVLGGLVLAGCSRGEPGLVPVQGRVFYRQQPLPGGTIVFTPDPQRGGRGPQAMARIGPDGRYQLQTGDRPGVVAGWHRITVAPARDQPLPPRYRDPDLSGQRFEVRPPGPGECVLHLE
jgi:hypothetical protein